MNAEKLRIFLYGEFFSVSFSITYQVGSHFHLFKRSCDEVEKETETKGRVSVEEAITAAKIRNCPKCSKPFIKSDGCNKIRCGCGAFVCYICRSLIKGYQHFCQTPHCNHANCNNCPLWTKAEEDDLRAMREAGVQAAEKVRLDSLLGETSKDSEDVRIDVDSILKNPGSNART